jgi:hypothetical protein
MDIKSTKIKTKIYMLQIRFNLLNKTQNIIKKLINKILMDEMNLRYVYNN